MTFVLVPSMLLGASAPAQASASGYDCRMVSLPKVGDTPQACLKFDVAGDGLIVQIGGTIGNPFTGYKSTQALVTVAGTICQPRVDLLFYNRSDKRYATIYGRELGGCYAVVREDWMQHLKNPMKFNASPGTVCAKVLSGGKPTTLKVCHNVH